MAIVTQKPMRPVGVGNMYHCFASGAPEAVDGYEADITRLKTLVKIDTTEEGTSEPVYGSNEVYEEESTSSPPALGIEALAYPPDVLARMRGNSVTGGFVIRSTFDTKEYFAQGVVFPKKNGHKRMVWYPKCLLTEANHSAQTADKSGGNGQNQSVTVQTYAFNEEGEYQVEYDTELLAAEVVPLTEEEFFAAVLTAPIVQG